MHDGLQNSLICPKTAAQDLEWAINSPSLVDAPRQQDLRTEHLEVSVAHLAEFMQQQRTHRVGRYFEALVRYAIDVSPGLQLLEHGLQIRDEGRTIGELDFVYANSAGIVRHLETAVKFYLYLPDRTCNGSHFVGPNSADNFESKHSRLINHQLALSHVWYPKATERLPLVKGIIFYHASQASPAVLPAGLSRHHLSGRWYYTREFPDSIDSVKHDVRYLIRSKPHWLADAAVAPGSPQLLSPQETSQFLLTHFQKNSRPIMLSELRKTGPDWRESTRLFVVDNGWPGSE